MSWFSITMFWNNKIQQRKQRREKYVVWEERCVRCQHLIIKYVTRYHSLECTVCRAPDRDREPPCLSCQDYCRSVQIICLSLKIFPLYFPFTTVGLLGFSQPFQRGKYLSGSDWETARHPHKGPGRSGKLCSNVGNWNLILVITESQLMFTDKGKNWNLITNETEDLGQMEIHRRQAQNISYILWLTHC